MSAAERPESTVRLDGACETGGSCDDCVFGCHDAPAATACGNDGGTASAEERLTVAASGVVIAVLAATVVATGRTPATLALAGVTTLAGLVLALVGGRAALRGGVLGDRLLDRGTRLLPWATGLLLVGIATRTVEFLAAHS